MWGGVKVRRHYGDHFRQWSATKGLDDLRRVLYQEPRPWFLAFSLHQRQHLLQDHHCARLVSWCATIVQLRETREEKQEAYRFAQEVFGMLTHSHKAGRDALFEYMRLCAVGRDLTMAFEWHKYWLDAKRRERNRDAVQGLGLLEQYAWLLRIALTSPSDESAEDMAIAVMEGYGDNCCSVAEHEETGQRVLVHFQPTNQEEEEALRGLFCGFRAIAQRLGMPRKEAGDEDDLYGFIAALPVTPEDAQRWLDKGWPTESHCHNFPQLEGGAKVLAPTPSQPRLRDSLLSPRLVAKLEKAAFAQRSASSVIAILKWYQECVTMERAKKDSGTRRLHQRTLEGEDIDVWRQFTDGTAQRFRAAVVEAGGLTPELYHYVICALAQTQPTAALRTLQRMRESNLHVLDLTRAVVLVAAQGSFSDQLQLFDEQLDEIANRRKLDEDYGISKRIEAYWKYQYTEFFHYTNAMNTAAFYEFLMEGLQTGKDQGPRAVQQLLLASRHHDPTVAEDDLVVLDDALRRSAVKYFRRRLGVSEVDTAMDLITRHMPKLDISLVGSLPHFSDYTLKEGDDIATDVAALAEKIAPYDVVYVLDTSFVETSEAFLNLGRQHNDANGNAERGQQSRSLVLIPYVTLAQLGESVANAGAFVTFDAALAEAVGGEPLLASQRLRALHASCAEERGHRPRQGGGGSGEVSSIPSSDVDVRLLHFTECLLAHSLPPETVTQDLGLTPDTSDNDHLFLILSLLSSLLRPTARLVLCSDDPLMVRRLAVAAGSGESGSGVPPPSSLASLFRSSVEVLGTPPPPSVDVESGVINDNPTVDFLPGDDDFVPKMGVSQALKDGRTAGLASENAGSSSPPTTPQLPQQQPRQRDGSDHAREAAADSFNGVSPWLSLLEEDNEKENSAAAALREDTAVVDAAVPSPPPLHNRNTTNQDNAAPVSSTAAATADDALVLAEKNEQEAEEELMNLYASPFDIVPVGVKMQTADAMGSVFTQFDVPEPDEAMEKEQDRQAQHSRLQHAGGGPGGKRRRSFLEREMLTNRGASYKERQRMARQLSNMSGGRVPFNLRYKVVEADVRDPRNASLKRKLDDGVRKTRAVYKKNNL